jgi:hypothetical protein
MERTTMKKSTQWDIVGVLGILLATIVLLAYHFYSQGFYVGQTFYYSTTPEVMLYLSIVIFAFSFFSFALGYMETRKQLPKHA